ncbi:MAG: hypothetical protein Q7R35_07025 [Elusimicrobiota bacterium]|nr:hypothetical protein [Elusimicrobiota bacterium]
MENEEKKISDFSDEEYDNPEEVPEHLRELLRAKMEARRTGEESPGARKEAALADLLLPGGSGLVGLVELLVKASRQPKPGAPGAPFPPSGAAAPGGSPGLHSEPFRSGPLKPASSGWALWLAALILAAFYFFRP